MQVIQTNELIKVVETSGLEEQTGSYIKEKFLPFFEQAEEWNRKAKTLVVTDINQKHEMQMARAARLALREIRINADKTRKELKEDSLRYGKAVQGVYNVIEYLIAPTEKYLEEQEKFAEIQEAKRKSELKADREMQLQPYMEYVPYGLPLGDMKEDEFSKLLTGAKLQLEAKIEAEKKAEQERIAREKAEAEERERIRLENEKLKAERAEAEKKMAEERAKVEAERKAAEEKARKEREAAEAKLKAERAERERLQAEIKAKEEAELKAKRDAEAKAEAERKAQALAEKKAKAAPDKAKLKDFAEFINNISYPEVKSEEAVKIISDAKGLLAKVSTYIIEKSESI